MQTKKYPGRQPGHKENGTSGEQNSFNSLQYITPESLCQTKHTFVSLAQARLTDLLVRAVSIDPYNLGEIELAALVDEANFLAEVEVGHDET